MELRIKTTRLLVSGLLVLLGVAPLCTYWLIWGRAPQITPTIAKQQLEQDEHNAVRLIDVRPMVIRQERFIEGSVHLSSDEILQIKDADDVPGDIRNATVFLICDNGNLSAKATRHLRSLGVENVYSVRGGMQDWVGTVESVEGGRFEKLITPAGQVDFPFKDSPLLEQLAMVVCAFAIKPAYVLLSFVLIIILWKCKSPDLAALRWAMIFFFLGENFCSLNYFLSDEKSYLFEYFHSFGMLLCFGFMVYAIIEGVDRRILLLSDPEKKCSAINLCRQCIKYTQAPCGLRRTFYLLIPACIVVALMLPTADLVDTSYNTYIFKTFYNYNHSLVHQLYEMRFLPAASIVLLATSLIVLICDEKRSIDHAKVIFAAGIASMGFGFLRMILIGSYSENLLWFAFWEEATELIFIAGVCYILWLFRKGLFGKSTETEVVEM